MIKKILLTCEDYYPVGGGIQQYIRGLAYYLTSQGVQVDILTQSYPEQQARTETPEATVYYSSLLTGSMGDPFTVMKRYNEIAAFIKDGGYDLVFSNNHNSLAVIKACKRVGVPVMYGCHGVGLMDPFRRRFLMADDEISWGFPGIRTSIRWIFKDRGSWWKKMIAALVFFSPLAISRKNYWLYKRSLTILNSADGRYGNSSLTATLFKNKANTFGFPLAINARHPNIAQYYYPHGNKDFLDTFGLEHKKYILCPGRMSRIKGQEYAVRAIKKINDQDIPLVLAGTADLFETKSNDIGSYGRHLKTLVDDLGLGQRVVFTGLLDFEHMRALYSSALVTMVPSVWLETFGYITLESMACGTPVIVTRNCGSAECVDRSTGIVVERKNAEQLADAFNTYRQHFLTMGERARKKSMQLYDWDVLGPRYLNMFCEVYKKYHENK